MKTKSKSATRTGKTRTYASLIQVEQIKFDIIGKEVLLSAPVTMQSQC